MDDGDHPWEISEVEECTGSLKSLLILCSSLTKSRQGWESVTSQVRIVHVNIVNQVCILCMSVYRPGGALSIVGAGLPFLAPAGSPVDGHTMSAKVRNIKKLRTLQKFFKK